MRRQVACVIADYYFVMRPTLFFPVWTVFLMGYLNSHFENQPLQSIFVLVSMNDLWQGQLIWSGLLLTLLCGGIFILNQVQDVISDRANQKLFLIANGIIPRFWANFEATVLVVGAIFSSFFIKFELGLLFLALFIFAGWFYSIRPFSWKDKPFWGLFSNALAGLFIFSSGWVIKNPFSLKTLLFSSSYILAVSAVYLYTTIPDQKGDEIAGKITFAVKYGFIQTVRLALIFGLGALIATFYFQDWLMLFPTLFSLPFFIQVYRTRAPKHLHYAIKMPISLLSFVICLKIPCYLIFLLINYYSAKWYYQKRFKLNYPSIAE